jgi:hypothetical protein
MMVMVATAVVVVVVIILLFVIIIIISIIDSLVLVRNLSKSCYMTHLRVISNFCDFSL